ncbi:hypothetical protein PHLGIDRAFT_119907 [Phlebiopsis gigantea 11061_1 CR5-6]|uniref:Tubulin-folding cofactor D ARM repeats domain-containing protein n=1 Tax=Phlebiopsis gigantea (strain 11061_1 CR5-6) TaxID=745531 RepID=A0A0C3PHM5_PHLG1|nr:hypothetical protein PHLGIDRAFT_119907 [Phlebiopsis gigantea 11061_1 CR5-6]
MAEEPAVEDRFYATFEKHDKFVAAQTRFLELCRKPLTSEEDDEVEQLLTKLSLILDEYQEQAYLLDPFLERLLGPVVEQFKLSVTHVSSSATHQSSTNISRVAFYLYRYIKFRGHKTITRFFPHEVDDLSIALTFLLTLEDSTEIKEYHRWPLRYVMLLWLSLICMLPFDLAQFDEPEDLGKTASDIESVAKQYLSKAGVERGGAAVLLSRLYTRPDTSTKFPDFLRWTVDGLQSSHQFFSTIGALEVVCELLKSGSISHVSPHMGLLSDLAIAVNENKALMNNTLVRKYRIKLISRIVLRLLPPRRTSKGRKGKALVSTSEQLVEDEDDEDGELPDELEDTLGDLFTALQDKDTVVRYSAAKAIARISERLPAEFTEQVLQQVLQLFAIHSVGAATLYDMPSIAESTWHGASLACAEMARRGLVADSRLGEVVDWMRQALFFDIRKGAHSVGSSVRDAASYVLWSLARAQDAAALARFADDLARTLVTVAVFDREVHIRRAASAAFQEFVGRTSLFPHGIDVLRKTDFYAVGTRRNAFLAAAPEVAEHDVYRDALLRHLLTVTVRHWDAAMRRLGAQAVRAICELDLWVLGPRCAAQAALLVDSADTGDLHGALWTLAELAAAFKAAGPEGPARPHLRQIFGHLAALSPAAVQSVRHEIVTAAACHLIANSIAREDVDAPGAQWRAIIDFSLKSASAPVQDAVADALAALSTLADCSAYVDR